MRILSVLAALLFVCPLAFAADGIAPAAAGLAGQRAFDDLGAYYEKGTEKMPPYAAALDALSASDEKMRNEAGASLAALFAQTEADESNGRARWRALPYWGGGSDNPARDFRKQLAEAFGAKAAGDAALDAAAWLLNQDRAPQNARAGMLVIRRTKSSRAADLIAEAITKPHPMQQILAALIEEAGLRGLKNLAPQIEKLCASPLTAVRTAAIAAAPKVGVATIPPYDSLAAFTPEITALLTDFNAMILPAIPAEASYAKFVVTTPGAPEEPARTRDVFGWIVSESNSEYHVVTYWGDETTLQKSQAIQSDWSLAKEASRLLSTRDEMKKSDEGPISMPLSRSGGLTGQFESRDLSLPEAVVSAWCYVRGDRASAAALLFPRLDALPDQRWAREIVRDLIGHAYHQRMLILFSHDRDYPRTIRYARHLSSHLFGEYQYQDRARELAAQLEKRTEDFKTFVLPTSVEWEEQKHALSRTQQIEYLAARLRLLNCFQWGQPGGVRPEDQQTREPKGEDFVRDAKVTVVINPLVELDKMKITVAELPTLVRQLPDDSFLPTFSYWRDFHPARYMYRSNELVAQLINSSAKRSLVSLDDYRAKDAAGREQYVQSILDWCQANRDRTAESLLLDSLAKAQDFPDVSAAAAELVQAKNPQTLELLKKRFPDFPKQHVQMIQFCYELDSPLAAPLARAWIKEETEPDAVMYAAFILLKHGDSAHGEGLAELKSKVLDPDDGSYRYQRVIGPLLDTHRREAIDLAAGILKKEQFWRSSGERGYILHRLVLLGRDDAYQEVLARLDSSESSGSSAGTRHGKSVTQSNTVGDSIAVDMNYWRIPNFDFDVLDDADVRATRRAQLKTWLEAQYKLIKAGKKSEISEIKPEPPPSEPRIDAPG